MVDPLPAVFPVSAAAALKWCEGELTDLDLLVKAPLRPEAIFILNLPHLAAYRQVLSACLDWYKAGAVCLITRTFNPVVDDHLLKYGGLPTFKERFRWIDTQYRFLLPPAAFQKFFSRLARQERERPTEAPV